MFDLIQLFSVIVRLKSDQFLFYSESYSVLFKNILKQNAEIKLTSQEKQTLASPDKAISTKPQLLFAKLPVQREHKTKTRL